jgi:hypothetical protein
MPLEILSRDDATRRDSAGELSTTIFVRDDNFDSNTSRSKEKPRLSTRGIGTGVAPRKLITDS